VVIVFHVVAYGLLQFVLDDIVNIHFLHLYAILFAVEVAIMLGIGHLQPRAEAWRYEASDLVDLTPWRFAIPVAAALLSAVIALYLLFSPIGLVDGLSASFWPLIALLVTGNAVVWWWTRSRHAGVRIKNQ
jgi:SSS family solute:Na+ symporter